MSTARETSARGDTLIGCLGAIVGLLFTLVVLFFVVGHFMFGPSPFFRDDVVKAKIHYLATDPGSELTDVSLFAGSGKTYWPTIDADETVSVPLVYSKYSTGHWHADSRVVVYLRYTLDGDTYHWDGSLSANGEGYRIGVEIDADGAVTYGCCVLPCRLGAGNKRSDKGCGEKFEVVAWYKDNSRADPRDVEALEKHLEDMTERLKKSSSSRTHELGSDSVPESK